jgi:outer membrane biosynthesis protein TonB
MTKLLAVLASTLFAGAVFAQAQPATPATPATPPAKTDAKPEAKGKDTKQTTKKKKTTKQQAAPKAEEKKS